MAPLLYARRIPASAPQALTAVLELLSLDAVRFVCRRKGGAKLYAQGVACNFINNAVLGPPLYELVSNRWMSQPFTPLGRAAMILAVIWGHSIGYYCDPNPNSNPNPNPYPDPNPNPKPKPNQATTARTAGCTRGACTGRTASTTSSTSWWCR